MLLMTMQVASTGVSCLTRVLTSVSFENKDGYSSRVMIKISDKMSAIMMEVIKATTNENFAFLGWAAPNSFDTLTLQQINVLINFRTNFPHIVMYVLILISSFDSTCLLSCNWPDCYIDAKWYHNGPSQYIHAARSIIFQKTK